MKIKTLESWSQYDVRDLCIKRDWYVKGTCDEYDKMLNYINEHYCPKSKDVYNVAKDIFEHSNKDNWIRGAGLSENEAIESIMFELYHYCVFRHFTIME